MDTLSNRQNLRSSLAGSLAVKRTTAATMLLLAVFSLGLWGCTSGTPGTDPGNSVAPAITTQPANQSVTVGQTATFTVVATGTAPLSYQWQKGTTNIAGATSASYTTPATQLSDSGSTFRVTITNSAGTTTSNSATLTVTAAPVAPSITTQPANQTVTAGQTATFTVVATGTTPLSYQWQKGTTNISGASSSSYTTPATTTADSGSTYRVIVTNSVGNATSNFATLTVNPAPPPGTVSVLTYHNDNARTGSNSNETILTTLNVNSTKFGKIGTMPVDGLVDAEPLYVPNLTISGQAHNVVFVATEHDSVYAFDADTFTQLWHISVLGSGETTVAKSDVGGCDQVEPEIGITSTPVIDLNRGPHGTIFVVAMSKSGSSYFQRLHALDLTTGAEQTGSPTTISATFEKPGHAGQFVTFDPHQYKERAALLLLNGVIYTTWASHCDIDPYTGWIMGYSESTLQQTSVLNITPNGDRGAIWMSGGGPAADSSGNIYVTIGNGSFNQNSSNFDVNGFPIDGDYGNAFLKLSAGGTPPLKVADYFNMHDTVSESSNDWDLSSGGAVVLLDMTDNTNKTWQLAVAAGKDARIYVVDRTNMGKFNSSTDNIHQEVTTAFTCVTGSCVFSTPAFFNNTLYFGAVNDNLKAFPFQNAQLVTPASSRSSGTFPYRGTTPSVSASGTSNGIVWAIQNCTSATSCTGVLHAYDATNLATELYNSNQASAGRDHFSTNWDCKFVTPMIANGKVYVGTGTNNGSPSGAVVVYGLLP